MADMAFRADEAPTYNENILLTPDSGDVGILVNQMRCAKNQLKVLDLHGKDIVDVGAITELHRPRPRKLFLQRNMIDVPIQRNVDSLINVNLSNNRIIDVRPLAGLHSLEILDLSFNQIEEAGPLARLSSLRQLYLQGNKISDIRPLGELGRLTGLNASMNRIGVVQALGKLRELRALGLSNNELLDVSGLVEMSSLELLNLSYNRIVEVGGLAGLHELQVLDLAHNRIANASPLGELHRLTRLNLTGNRVVDVSELGGLKHLTKLDLSRNLIADASALSGLKYLRSVSLGGNPCCWGIPREGVARALPGRCPLFSGEDPAAAGAGCGVLKVRDEEAIVALYRSRWERLYGDWLEQVAEGACAGLDGVKRAVEGGGEKCGWAGGVERLRGLAKKKAEEGGWLGKKMARATVKLAQKSPVLSRVNAYARDVLVLSKATWPHVFSTLGTALGRLGPLSRLLLEALQELEEEPNGLVRLYRACELSTEELQAFQDGEGKLVLLTQFLQFSSEAKAASGVAVERGKEKVLLTFWRRGHRGSGAHTKSKTVLLPAFTVARVASVTFASGQWTVWLEEPWELLEESQAATKFCSV
jgi:hypothetical protein